MIPNSSYHRSRCEEDSHTEVLAAHSVPRQQVEEQSRPNPSQTARVVIDPAIKINSTYRMTCQMFLLHLHFESTSQSIIEEAFSFSLLLLIANFSNLILY